MYGSTSTRYIYNGPRTTEHLLQFLDLFYRRLDPEADFAEEVNVNNDMLGLPMRVNNENLDSIDMKKVKPSATIGRGAIEGCEISGSISVNRVPGTLVFTARSNEVSFDSHAVDVSHIVNHFSFGQMKRSEFLLDGRLDILPTNRFPLDRKLFDVDVDNMTVEHFLNVSLHWWGWYLTSEHLSDDITRCVLLQVVGFDHEHKRSSRYDTSIRMYEFSATTTQYNATAALPAALFSFDISPLVIQILSDSVPFYRFITSLCAVVGGVFTVIGLVNSGVFYAMNSIKKKQQLGKFS